MKKKQVSWSVGIFLTLIFIVSCNIPSAWAAAPWHWNFAMKQALLKDSMNMPTALYIDKAKEHYYVVDSGKNRLLSFNRQGELDRKSTRLNSSHIPLSRMPSSA